MQETKHNRTKLLTLSLTPTEYEQLKSRFKTTKCRKLSDYLRKVLLTGKVTVFTRNQSLDDFMAEMIDLRKELNAIGNNFNQAVHKLHILEKIPEFRSWILINDSDKKILMNKVDEIKNRINQFAEKW
ncbi:MAG: plasmid mobilization protein [Chitinophagaceae bacterium]